MTSRLRGVCARLSALAARAGVLASSEALTVPSGWCARWEVPISLALMGVFSALALGGLWVAWQIPFALIDDFHTCELAAQVWADGLPGFLWKQFGSPSIVRFRWAWELYSVLVWTGVGPHPGMQHVLQFSLRMACCAAAVRLLGALLGCAVRPVAIVMVTAYGFFFPVVPESRLSPVEPLQCLLILACLAWTARLLRERGGDLGLVTTRSKVAFGLSFLLLSGMKETSLPIMAILLAVILLCQVYHRRRCALFSLSLLFVSGMALWRTLVALRVSWYADVLLSKEAGGSVGWLAYRMRCLVGQLSMADWTRPWLGVSVGVLCVAMAVRIALLLIRVETRRAVAPWLVVGLCAAAMLGMYSRLPAAPRYMYPLVWVTAVFVGGGVDALLRVCPCNLWSVALVAAAGCFLAVGNWPDFLWHFACQKASRDSETHLLMSISAAADRAPDLPVHMVAPFGTLGGKAPATVPDEKFESIRLYLTRFRPRYSGAREIAARYVSAPLDSGRTAGPAIVVSRLDVRATPLDTCGKLHVQNLTRFCPVVDSSAVQFCLAVRRLLGDLWLGPCLVPAADYGAPETVAGGASDVWQTAMVTLGPAL